MSKSFDILRCVLQEACCHFSGISSGFSWSSLQWVQYLCWNACFILLPCLHLISVPCAFQVGSCLPLCSSLLPLCVAAAHTNLYSLGHCCWRNTFEHWELVALSYEGFKYLDQYCEL